MNVRWRARSWRAIGAAALGIAAMASSGVATRAAHATTVGILPNGFGGIVVDGGHNHVFVSSPISNTITVLDYTGHVVSTISAEAGAGAMVIDGGKLYVALRDGGAIDVFDASTLARLPSLGSGHLVQPGPLVKADGKLWTSTGPCGQSSTQLASVDMTTGAVQSFTMSVATSLSYCIGLAGNPAQPNLLLAWDLGLDPATISKIDVSTGTPQVLAAQWEQDQGNLKQIAFNPDGATFVTASGAPYQFDEFRLSDLGLDGFIYPATPYPNAVVTTSARGGLIVGGLDGVYNDDFHTFRPGQPNVDLMHYELGGPSNTLYDAGMALSPDGALLFAVSGDSLSGATYFNVIPVANTSATSLKASSSSVALNAPVTITANVGVASGGFPAPTGTVTFLDNGVSVATAPLTNGQASVIMSWSQAGKHSIGAHYNGDTNNQASGQDTLVSAGALTTTSLTSSANPATAGQTVTFTATVGGGSSPTGTVTFFDGSPTSTTISLVSGTASYTSSTLTAGTHYVSATYNGDALNTPSTSSTLTETVNGVAVVDTATQVASSVNPITVGSPVTFTATVGANNGTVPGGTVTFVDTSSPAQLGTGTLVNGQAQFTTSNLSVGQHPVYAAYNGDSAHGPSKSVTVTENVNGLETQTAVIASPSPVVVGQPVTFTATITGGSTAKTGTVTFQDGSSALSTVAVSASGATFTTSGLSVGVHAISAVYNGDSLNGSSSGSVSETVSKEASAVQLTSSKNPVSRRTAVTFTATVTVTLGTIAPTGKVTFYLGKASTGTVLASVSLSSGKSAFTTSTLPTGYDTITAVYSGDASVKSSSTQLVQRIK